MTPDLDRWLPDPGLRIHHQRSSSVAPGELWEAAGSVRVGEVGLLGRLVRWRLPGTPADTTFDELFRRPPFRVLEESKTALVSGLVGRIWTLRRDYPLLHSPEEFADFGTRGMAKVVFAHWVNGEQEPGPQSSLHSEARVQALGTQGRLGVRAVRPLISTFQGLIGSEGIEAALRRAEPG